MTSNPFVEGTLSPETDFLLPFASPEQTGPLMILSPIASRTRRRRREKIRPFPDLGEAPDFGEAMQSLFATPSPSPRRQPDVVMIESGSEEEMDTGETIPSMTTTIFEFGSNALGIGSPSPRKEAKKEVEENIYSPDNPFLGAQIRRYQELATPQIPITHTPVPPPTSPPASPPAPTIIESGLQDLMPEIFGRSATTSEPKERATPTMARAVQIGPRSPSFMEALNSIGFALGGRDAPTASARSIPPAPPPPPSLFSIGAPRRGRRKRVRGRRSSGQTAAQRAASLRNLAKARAAKKRISRRPSKPRKRKRKAPSRRPAKRARKGQWDTAVFGRLTRQRPKRADQKRWMLKHTAGVRASPKAVQLANRWLNSNSKAGTAKRRKLMGAFSQHLAWAFQQSGKKTITVAMARNAAKDATLSQRPSAFLSKKRYYPRAQMKRKSGKRMYPKWKWPGQYPR
jgi:hypothetical protein